MIAESAQIDDHLCTCGMGERRRMERLFDPFPVKLRGVDAEGQGFEVNTVIKNIGAGGLYVQLSKRVETGSRLFSVTRFSTAALEVQRGPLIAMSGRVVRVDPQPDGSFGLAVEFTSSRFL